MWKAAGGVKVSSTKLEASLPTAVSQRKRVHSFWKVPPGTRAWMDTTAKTQPPYHMLHDLRGNTHIHIWVSTSERLSGLLMAIIARIVPAPPFLPISPSKPLPKIYFLFVPSLLLSQSLLAIIYRNLSTRLWLIRLLWWNSLLHHTGLIRVDIFFPKVADFSRSSIPSFSLLKPEKLKKCDAGLLIDEIFGDAKTCVFWTH